MFLIQLLNFLSGCRFYELCSSVPVFQWKRILCCIWEVCRLLSGTNRKLNEKLYLFESLFLSFYSFMCQLKRRFWAFLYKLRQYLFDKRNLVYQNLLVYQKLWHTFRLKWKLMISEKKNYEVQINKRTQKLSLEPRLSFRMIWLMMMWWSLTMESRSSCG